MSCCNAAPRCGYVSACRNQNINWATTQGYATTNAIDLSATESAFLNDTGLVFTVPCASNVLQTFSGSVIGQQSNVQGDVTVTLEVYPVVQPGNISQAAAPPVVTIQTGIATPVTAHTSWALSAGTYVFKVKFTCISGGPVSFTTLGSLTISAQRTSV